MHLAPGTRLGPYEIISPIGAGGMGEVFKARDVRLDRIVAVKELPSGGRHVASLEGWRLRPAPAGGRNSIAVSQDGKRFLINMMATEGANTAPFTVLVNWTTGLKH